LVVGGQPHEPISPGFSIFRWNGKEFSKVKYADLVWMDAPKGRMLKWTKINDREYLTHLHHPNPKNPPNPPLFTSQTPIYRASVSSISNVVPEFVIAIDSQRILWYHHLYVHHKNTLQK
jgi:hypothetical protein